MGIFGIIKKIAEPVLGIVDKAVKDKDLAKQLKHDIEMELLASAENMEKELTARHELDMQSDSWLSKNIRPLTLAFLMFVFVIISFSDGNIGQFNLNPEYVPVYQTLLSLVFTFYFGSRGIEKGIKMYTQSKNK